MSKAYDYAIFQGFLKIPRKSLSAKLTRLLHFYMPTSSFSVNSLHVVFTKLRSFISWSESENDCYLSF